MAATGAGAAVIGAGVAAVGIAVTGKPRQAANWTGIAAAVPVSIPGRSNSTADESSAASLKANEPENENGRAG
ncbi:hypothetical protein TM102_33090 [Bradyrhizobium sp. TM102]|nr:hypothetical protein TM102_33090 [Bradyrhizobium sp. TM102]